MSKSGRVKVAGIQFSCKIGDKEANLQKALSLIDKASKDEVEINPLEEGNDEILGDLANKFFIIKKYFDKEELPPTEENYCQRFEEDYGIIITSEEMLEIRAFMEEDYADWAQMRIQEDFKHGMEFINLRKLGLE